MLIPKHHIEINGDYSKLIEDATGECVVMWKSWGGNPLEDRITWFRNKPRVKVKTVSQRCEY